MAALGMALGVAISSAPAQEQDLCDYINSQPGWEAVDCKVMPDSTRQFGREGVDIRFQDMPSDAPAYCSTLKSAAKSFFSLSNNDLGMASELERYGELMDGFSEDDGDGDFLKGAALDRYEHSVWKEVLGDVGVHEGMHAICNDGDDSTDCDTDGDGEISEDEVDSMANACTEPD